MLATVYLVLKSVVFVRFAIAIKRSLVANSRSRPAVAAISTSGTAFFFVSAYADVRHQSTAAVLTTAIVLVALSALLFESSLIAARRAFLGFAFSKITPSRIVTDGPYGWVRHPIYLSYEIYWIGNLVVSRNAILLVLFAILSIMYVAAAVQEERLLAGDPAYRSYRKRSAAVIPYII